MTQGQYVGKNKTQSVQNVGCDTIILRVGAKWKKEYPPQFEEGGDEFVRKVDYNGRVICLKINDVLHVNV